MAAYPVSDKVNKPANNTPDLLAKVEISAKEQDDLFC